MKRKLKETEETEEIVENVTKLKKVKNDEPEEAGDEDACPIQAKLFEMATKFDIKKFRQNLKSGNFYDDLKLFVKKGDKAQELVKSFIESGGKPLEIVETIKNNESANMETLSYLYHMLRMVIFYIMNEEGQKTDSTVQALKFLVNRNKVSVEKMIQCPKLTDKVLMLKILSIAISLDCEIGRDILKNIDIFAKSTEKDDFSMLEDNPKRKMAYEDTIRLAFVHFFLGFLLNEKDMILRKKILQKRSLFEFFMRDIHKDNFETIKSIITCLTKNVLVSPAFNKPEKLKIFNDNVIKSVLKLYEWKGEEKEQASVINITHQFLLLLLTSKKHGIVFKALSEKRQNLRQLHVINLFKSVWNLEHPSILVIEIIKSCPDLMQNLLNKLVMGLQPKVTANWFMCANFTKELITVMDPSSMINSFSMLEAKKISTNIIKLSISQFILQNLNEQALIQQESLEIRESSVQLLHLMMDRCCKYLDEVKKIPTLKDFEKHRIKFDIINHIFTFYPNIDIILNSLYRSINLSTKKKSDDSEKLVKSQLKHTLEILLLVIKHFPSIIEKIPSVIDYLEVLRPIYEFQLSGSDDVDGNEDLQIELKVVKIVLSLQPSILSLDSEMFPQIFSVLIQVYCCSLNDDQRNEAKVLLMKILFNTMLFPSQDSLEVSVWLEAFKSVKRGILKESATQFVKALRTIKSGDNGDFKWNLEIEQIVTFELLAQIDAAKDIDVIENKLELSPVLPAVLNMKSSKINRIIEFVEVSMILLYHSYPHQKKSFLRLLETKGVDLNTKISSYIKKKSLIDLGITLDFSEDLVYRKSQLAVINEDKFELDAKDTQTLELLIVHRVFCALKLEKSGELTDKKVEILSSSIKSFYEKLLQAESSESSFANHDDFENVSAENGEKKVNKIWELSINRPSKNIVRYIFKQQNMLLDNFSIASPTQMTKFVAQLGDIFKTSQDFESCSRGFRGKIINELIEVLNSGKVHEEILDVIEKFPLDAVNCCTILNVLVQQKISIKEFHIKVTKMLIERLTQLKTSPLTAKMMEKVEKIYVHAAENTAIDLSGLDVALLEYLMTFNHNIGDLTKKIFKLAFREDQSATRSFVRLMCKMFARNDAWNEMFKSDVMKLKKELMYPLLGVAMKKGIIGADKLKPIYQDFKSGMIKAIERPNKAAQIYRENPETSMKLIELAMPLNECQDLAMKKFKFDQSEIYQLKMLQAIFTKAFKASGEGKIFTNFMNHWLHLFGLSVAKSTNVNEEYFEVLEDWLKIKTAKTELSGNEMGGTNWEAFYKTCLKTGLKSLEGSKMLLLLAKVLRSIEVNPDEVATIFDMILTHSNFFNVVFNFKSSGRVLKRNLFFLLNVLVQKNPAVAHEKHVPILLSSYQASITSCDQLILNLLRFYELKCEIDFFDYRPFMFGPAALTHFTSNDDQEMKLIKKNVDDMNVVFMKLLTLFEKSTVENTVNNYPIKRQLAGVPANDLDQFLIDDNDSENIYDPGYFLPLFEMIFASSTFNFKSAAVRNNLMSLIMPALSCEDENMRLLSAHILMKCRESNDNNKKGQNDVWIRFYDSLQFGLGEVVEGTKVEGKPDEKHFPRAASISTQILAEFVNILPNSLHNVYSVVTNYLAIREKFEFSRIPEMMVLFHSSDVQHEEQRLFILNAICHGIKDDLDFKLLNNTPLLKMILSCYGCPLSDRKIDLAILRIIDRIVTKTSQTDLLMENFGLAVWILQISANVEAFEYDQIDMILSLIEHSVNTIQADRKGDDSSRRLLASLLVLLPKFTLTRLSTASFLSFLKAINQARSLKEITATHHDLIVELMKVFIPENHLQQLTYLNKHPAACKYAESKEEFTSAIAPHTDTITKSILIESREWLMKYHKSKK